MFSLCAIILLKSFFSETLKDRLQKAHLTNQGIELSSLDLSMKSRTDGINNKING